MNARERYEREFIPNIVASSRFKEWRDDNPGEHGRLVLYRQALAAGDSPAPPALRTRFGRAMVAAAAMAGPRPRDSSPKPSPAPSPEPTPRPATVWAGDGAWVGSIDNVDLPILHAAIVPLGYRYVGVKVHHGPKPVNAEGLSGAVSEIRQAGATPVFWGWVGDDEPSLEAELASRICDEHAVAHYAANYEKDIDRRWNWSRAWISAFGLASPDRHLALFAIGAAALDGQKFTPYQVPVDYSAWRDAGADLIAESFWAPVWSETAQQGGAAPEYRPSNVVHHSVVKAGFDPARVHLAFGLWGASYLADAASYVAELEAEEDAGSIPRTHGRSIFDADQCPTSRPDWAIVASR